MLSLLPVLAQYSTDYNYTYDVTSNKAAAGFGVIWLIFWLAVAVFILFAMVKVFAKAGRKWWEAIVPIYNTYVLLQIVGRPGWWLLLLLIPFVNIIFAIIVYIDLAKAFGKGAGVGILTILFPYIMLPIFAFSKDYKYVGPVAANPSNNPVATPPVDTPPTNPAPPAPVS